MEEDWLTEEQLLALAAAEGFHPPELTPRKLKRWRMERLLPQPRLISLGKRQGMRSEYPPGTAKQLLALCQHLRRFPHDLDAVRFILWYEGYSIPLNDVKQSIEQLLKPLQKYFATAATNAPDTLAAAEQTAKQLQKKLARSKWGRRFKLLGNEEDINAVLTAVSQMWLGDTPGFTAHADEEHGERSLAELFIDMMGLKRAQTDRIGDVPPWLPQDMGEISRQLENLAGKQLLSIDAHLQTLKELTPKQLAQARNDLAGMLGLKQMAKAMETFFGPNAFGFGLFGELPNDPDFLALLLLVFARQRADEYAVALNTIEATLKDTKSTYQQLRAFIKTLQKELPDTAEEYITQAHALDLSDQRAFDKLHTIALEVRAAHPEELDAFFQRHPELRIPDGES